MKHVLVIQLARFGDLIQTKRLISSLLAEEDTAVHLCVDGSLEKLAKLVYPQTHIYPIYAHGTGIQSTEAPLKMLTTNRSHFNRMQAVDFEHIYNLNLSGLNYRIAALFDPQRVSGYAWHNGQEIISTWPSMAMRWASNRRLAMNLVDFWGGYHSNMISPDEVNPPATPKGGGIGVVLSGRESRRSLPADLLAQIVSTHVQKEKAQAIYLLGNETEYLAGQNVIKTLPSFLQEKVHNVAGKTNWQDLYDLVGSLDSLLTPDTGTMHLACHLGTPVIAFFLSSAWCFETGPYGEGHTVYQAVTDCSPCLESHPCLYDVQCRTPLEESQFQRYVVTQNPDHLPQGIVGYRTEFDQLGQTYSVLAGVDNDLEQRGRFRQLIHNYLTGSISTSRQNECHLAQKIFTEREWIAGTIPSKTLGI